MKITKSRWDEAQVFELNDWKNEKDIIEKEWEEVRQKYKEYFLKLEKDIGVNENWKIVDIGCSFSCVSRLISSGQRFGVEPLADKLEIDGKVPGVKVYQGMGEDMHFFDTNMFDLAVCRNVIDHTFSPNKVIDEIIRVLKPKSYLVLACYVYNPFISFIKNIGEAIKIFSSVGHPHTYTMGSLEDLTKEKFSILDKKVVYEGKGPNDFGKIDEKEGKLTLVQRIVMLVNNKIFRNKWFVREYAILCKLDK